MKIASPPEVQPLAGRDDRAPTSLADEPPGSRVMGKGDKQRSNREAKKPKKDKKAAPASASVLKPQSQGGKPEGKSGK